LIARAIHRNSSVSNGTFVKVNCAAIPPELIESELFGHERGAFTGAVAKKRGLFEVADGGTIFLDEIGDMALSAQAKVLRVLQTGEFTRVGGEKSLRTDCRVVAATNRDLEEMVKGGSFREDLYFRLNVVPIRSPELKERADDIPLLVESFVRECCDENGLGYKPVDDQVLERLKQYDWPGNVRELRAAINRAVVFGGERLGPDDFFSSTGHIRNRHLTPPFTTEELNSIAPYHAVLRSSMEQALHKHGTIRAAATAIGMPKSTFADKAKAWKLVPRRRVRVRNPTKK
jgi:transcriptional regulator with GAF, ATPase, and Fis domain